MILSIKTQADPTVLKYVNETLDRIANRDDLAKNPFIGKGRFCIRKEGEENALYTIIKLESAYFQIAFNLIVFFLGGVILLSLLMGRLFFPWYVVLIAGFVLAFNFMTTNHFYYLIIKAGLRKNQYKGPIKKIPLSEYLEVAYFDTVK